MTILRFLLPPAALLMVASPLRPQPVQQPAPPSTDVMDAFKQGKDLWANQGDRDGAAAQFEKVLAALQPKAQTLDSEMMRVLCESYNWLAVLEDRNPAKKAEATKRVEALVDFNPEFELDKNITSAKLLSIYDSLRDAKFAKVGFTYLPEGGVLKVDGKPGAALPSRYLGLGPHKLTYAKPGFAPQEVSVDLVPKEAKNVDFKLDRNASTITFYSYPAGVDVALDGKPLGKTSGRAPDEMKTLAEKAGLKVEDLSGPFVISDLKVGKHLLELKAACFRPKRVELDESFTTPYNDHILEAIKLDPSRGTLTVTSAWPGGELLLSGQSYGPLPVNGVSVCAGSYDLVVKYPAGGFAQRIEVPENKSVNLAAKPKPRIVFLGLEGSEDFSGKARLLAQVQAMGGRLKEAAFLSAKEGETPAAALARVKTSKEAELILSLVPVRDRMGAPADLVLATLDGEEERFPIKPLDEDPLDELVRRLNTQPRIWEPSVGLVLADLPGEPGPTVLSASLGADESGRPPVQILKPITLAGGKAVATALAFRQALMEAKGDSLAVTQAGVSLNLPIRHEPLELALQAGNLSYAFVLAELRLRGLAAKGDEAAFLKLNQAIGLMHFRRFDKALELLRDLKLSESRSSGLGLGQGTVDYYEGVCLSHLGSVYIPEAIQAYLRAQKSLSSTLFGPDGPMVAPLAKQAAEDLKN